VVRTQMTLSMELHRGRTQWSDPTGVTELALALASGELDAWSGRFVSAGWTLRAAARPGRVRPWATGRAPFVCGHGGPGSCGVICIYSHDTV